MSPIARSSDLSLCIAHTAAQAAAVCDDSLELAVLALKQESFPRDHAETAESLAVMDSQLSTSSSLPGLSGLLTTNEKWATLFRESSLESEEKMIRKATELLNQPDIQLNLRRESDGATAFSIACERRFSRLAMLLLDHPQFDPSCCTKAGYSSMAIASMNGLVEVVQVLSAKAPSPRAEAQHLHFSIVCSECGSNQQGLSNEYGAYSMCMECAQEDSVFCPLVV